MKFKPNSLMMKKSLMIMIAMIGLTTACSSKPAGKDAGQTQNNTTTESGKPEHITYDEFLVKVWNFEENPQKWVFKGDIPVIIDFYADWCGPCKKIAPIMDKIAKEYDGKVKVYKINVDNERKLAGVFQVQSIPSVLFVPMSGQPSMQTGALPEDAYYKIVKEQLLVK
jgi:thioredoxin